MTTTPDDRATAKPAACGACGAERLGRGFRDWKVDGRYRRESKILCACGVEGPWAPCHPATDDAVAAWNRMWAPRAGEATKRVMNRLLDDTFLYIAQHRADPGKLSPWYLSRVNVDDISAAIAELGLAAGREEGRG